MDNFNFCFHKNLIYLHTVNSTNSEPRKYTKLTQKVLNQIRRLLTIKKLKEISEMTPVSVSRIYEIKKYLETNVNEISFQNFMKS